ncbi:MAG: hypothetical protein LBJ32_04935, partial [Oscillospiraceae bacterium]|nr:hypothetical protein [Oscillospiraceae bacterium]
MKLKLNKWPKFDVRTRNDLIFKFRKLAKQYTPEWSFDEKNSDFGVTLAKIFCEMQENTLSKLNKSLYNLYLTFLQLIGTTPKPAVPASGIVVVEAMENSSGSYIPKSTRITADGPDGDIIFETQEDIFIIDSNIKKIIFTNFENDKIISAYENEFKPFRIYDCQNNKNLQYRAIYLYNDIIFNSSETNLIFSFENRFSKKSEEELLEVLSKSEWQYFDGKNWEKIEIVKKTENKCIEVLFSSKPQKTNFMDKTARFIRVIPNCSEIKLTKITCISTPKKLQPEIFISDENQLEKSEFLPFDEKYMLYNCFYIKSDEVFSKIGAKIEFEVKLHFIKIKTDLKNSEIKYKFIMSDMDFSNMEPYDITIEKVMWEYWNGSGWAKLNFLSNNESRIFEATGKDEIRKLSFICPKDLKEISVGAYDGLFIRARIAKINNQFDIMANYITPCISDFSINYSFSNPEELREVFICANADKYRLEFPTNCDIPISLIENIISKEPTMYICLEKGIVGGPIRIFFDIQEGIYRNKHLTKWEHWAKSSNGNFEWKYLNVIDGTSGFTHSGTVTILGKDDFILRNLFGITGFFLRITNINGSFNNLKTECLPTILDIKFNAVKILQKESTEPEFFEIESGQKNKICTLSHKGVSGITVWVNEAGRISTQEKDELAQDPEDKAQIKYNSLGDMEKIWVKWQPVDSFLSSGPQDRVYQINFSESQIIFGDGKNGKIPPEQYDESIKIEYFFCVGQNGNIDSGAVKDFASVMPNATKLYNPYPISGGLDLEKLENTAQRLFLEIQGGDRLVSAQDFEKAILSNDRNIYAVKCLAHINKFSETDIGQISIAILPKNFPCGHKNFEGIKKQILKLLK